MVFCFYLCLAQIFLNTLSQQLIIFIRQYNYCRSKMSKFKVKFNYGQDHIVQVKEAHKGPISYDHLSATADSKQKQVTHLQEKKEKSIIEAALQKTQTIVQQKKKVQRQLSTVKSADNLPSITPLSLQTSEKKKPILNIQEADETQFNKVNPTIPIPHEEEKNIVTNQEARIVAPTFRATRKPGEITGNSPLKKGYVKGENVEKYLYTGLPQKQEDEFVGCFGCMRRKPKTYSVSAEKKN